MRCTGAILTRYLALGGTGSRLGPPISDEYTVAAGYRIDFRHGAIIWNGATRTTTVIPYTADWSKEQAVLGWRGGVAGIT
jgi:uncharacterized protein with LGFP repeats